MPGRGCLDGGGLAKPMLLPDAGYYRAADAAVLFVILDALLVVLVDVLLGLNRIVRGLARLLEVFLERKCRLLRSEASVARVRILRSRKLALVVHHGRLIPFDRVHLRYLMVLLIHAFCEV